MEAVEALTVDTVADFDEKLRQIVAKMRFFDIAPFHRAWYEIVGEERAQELEKPRFARDGSFEFHVTVASFNEVEKYGLELDEPFDVSVSLKSIGKVENDGREAWFVIVDSPEIDRWREETGLCKKNLYITLGFDEKDIRHLPKDESTAVDDEKIHELVTEWVAKHPNQFAVVPAA